MLNRRNTALLILGIASLGLCACSSTPNDYSYRAAAEIRSDITPTMSTLNGRDVDRANVQALAEDSNLRALNDDWDSFWLIDRPSRLTEFPHLR